MPDHGRTWGERIAAGKACLNTAAIDEPDVKLRWVAAHLLHCNLMEVRTRLQEIPDADQAVAWEQAVARLEQDEPVQYVIGETDFMGLRIQCDHRALIPRPETELLVEEAESFLQNRPEAPVVVDVCTGTGCIACALAMRNPRARVIAIDLSPEALALARLNVQALGASVELRQGDLLDGIAESSVDLVVSNPPYVRAAECDRLPRLVRDFEPRLALDGGPDGLQVISRLVSEAAHVLTSGGQFILEIGEDQADAVTELLCQKTHFNQINLKSDYAGLARVIRAVRLPR
jgi:release factor glutamine methyltransferase